MQHDRFTRRITRISLFRQLIAAITGRHRRLIRGHIRIFSITRRIIQRVTIVARRFRQRARPNRQHTRVIKSPNRRRFALTANLLSIFNRLIRNTVSLNRFTQHITSQRTRATTLTRLPYNVSRAFRQLVRLASRSPHQHNQRRASNRRPTRCIPSFLTARQVQMRQRFRPTVTRTQYPSPRHQ